MSFYGVFPYGETSLLSVFPYRQTPLLSFFSYGQTPLLSVFPYRRFPLNVFSLIGDSHFSYNIKCFPLWANVIFRGVL